MTVLWSIMSKELKFRRQLFLVLRVGNVAVMICCHLLVKQCVAFKSVKNHFSRSLGYFYTHLLNGINELQHCFCLFG